MPTPKKTAKAAAAPKPRSVPLVDLTEDDFDPDAVEQVHLFSLGAVDYTIPAESPVSVLLELQRLARDQGEDMAMLWLFDQLLGPVKARELCTYKRLSKANLNRVYAACVETLTGPKAEG